MYRMRKGGQLEYCGKNDFEKSDWSIGIVTEQEWEECEEIRKRCQIPYEKTFIHFSKMETYANYAFATFRIPPKRENEVSLSFSLYLLPESLLFVDDGNAVNSQIQKIMGRKQRGTDSLERFLSEFLNSLLEEDLLFLQELEREIAMIEEAVLNKYCPEFNGKMLMLKKKIAKFCRYYTQLADVGQDLSDCELGFFGNEASRLFDRFYDRASRLAGETQILRDYAMQVQDVYQSEINIRQNDVMKILTVVTTIFLPLTLIAGWYGMNFAYMPELGMRYAYPVVIGISVLIVVLSLIIFKKKRYW